MGAILNFGGSSKCALCKCGTVFGNKLWTKDVLLFQLKRGPKRKDTRVLFQKVGLVETEFVKPEMRFLT